jgi:hypothetical protein
MTADAEIDARGLADLGLQWVQHAERADRAVEDEIFRAPVQQLLDVEFLAAMLAKGASV